MPVPLDEYPIHQAPLSLAYVATSDRNFYDRSYFNAHACSDELILVTGLGVYPNLGVIDAYATVRKGDQDAAPGRGDAALHLAGRAAGGDRGRDADVDRAQRRRRLQRRPGLGHGQWRGEAFAEGAVYDLSDP